MPTLSYYSKTFKGEPVNEADFPSLLFRAWEIIGELTMYRVSENTVSCLPIEMRECVKKAVCAQIEYMDANGGSDLDNGNDLQSAGLGKFNYAKSAGSDGDTSSRMYAPRALRYLAPTGLLYRGGGCV